VGILLAKTLAYVDLGFPEKTINNGITTNTACSFVEEKPAILAIC
jgi:hypothetical protein